jgi:hypothetical protein
MEYNHNPNSADKSYEGWRGAVSGIAREAAAVAKVVEPEAMRMQEEMVALLRDSIHPDSTPLLGPAHTSMYASRDDWGAMHTECIRQQDVGWVVTVNFGGDAVFYFPEHRLRVRLSRGQVMVWNSNWLHGLERQPIPHGSRLMSFYLKLAVLKMSPNWGRMQKRLLQLGWMRGDNRLARQQLALDDWVRHLSPTGRTIAVEWLSWGTATAGSTSGPPQQQQQEQQLGEEKQKHQHQRPPQRPQRTQRRQKQHTEEEMPQQQQRQQQQLQLQPLPQMETGGKAMDNERRAVHLLESVCQDTQLEDDLRGEMLVAEVLRTRATVDVQPVTHDAVVTQPMHVTPTAAVHPVVDESLLDDEQMRAVLTSELQHGHVQRGQRQQEEEQQRQRQQGQQVEQQ